MDFEFADSIRSTHTAENHDGEHRCNSGNRHAASGKQAEKMWSNSFIIFCNVAVSVICAHSFQFEWTTKQPKLSGGWLRTLTWCYWWVWSSPEDRSYLRSCSGTGTSCWPRCPAETSSPGPGSRCPSALPLQQSCARVWSCRLGCRKEKQ